MNRIKTEKLTGKSLNVTQQLMSELLFLTHGTRHYVFAHSWCEIS